MSPAEAAVVKSALKVVVDQELPALISAEEARLPPPINPSLVRWCRRSSRNCKPSSTRKSTQSAARLPPPR